MDVGDGCWRSNVLVTTLLSWCRHQHHISTLHVCDVHDRVECHQYAEKCHQH